MKFTSILSSLILLPALALADDVTFDQIYDEGTESLNFVACSDGLNGLETKGFTTFSSLPNFPFIGGAVAVEGFNSVNCGTCWNLTFVTGGVSRTISVLAIDHAAPGFNIALQSRYYEENLFRRPGTHYQLHNRRHNLFPSAYFIWRNSFTSAMTVTPDSSRHV
ncbi:hypothetical protein C0992_003164 [Termitomyces sp. T32_za158]|nr:hypothetical protein C0992_003164 [Termitomyces sp. T32_za158]